MPNTIDLKRNSKDFALPGISFSVSSRSITPEMDPAAYLRAFFFYVPLNRIESVFGNPATPSRLYGGRSYNPQHSLTGRHIGRLHEMGIGLALTLTNHFFDEEAYRESLPLLKAHHRPGNSVICTRDELARRIRLDFPDYELKASIIKHCNTIEKIERCLELYDQVVPPMDMNDDDTFLQALSPKSRILLFANATCAYNCPVRSCYLGFSQKNRGAEVTSLCSRDRLPRPDPGHIFFNVGYFQSLGYRRFKLVPLAPPKAEEAALRLSRDRYRPDPENPQQGSDHV